MHYKAFVMCFFFNMSDEFWHVNYNKDEIHHTITLEYFSDVFLNNLHYVLLSSNAFYWKLIDF